MPFDVTISLLVVITFVLLLEYRQFYWRFTQKLSGDGGARRPVSGPFGLLPALGAGRRVLATVPPPIAPKTALGPKVSRSKSLSTAFTHTITIHVYIASRIVIIIIIINAHRRSSINNMIGQMLAASVTVLEIVGIVVAAALLLFRRRRPARHAAASIPGPLALPVLGTSWVFSAMGPYRISELHLYYAEMHRKYGPVVREEALGNVPVISLFTRRDIERVLRSGGKYPLRPPCEAMAQYRRSRPDRYSSAGFVNEQGEVWHNLRSALTPVLMSPKTITNFLPQVHQIADDWCHLIRQRRVADKIDNLELLADNLGLEVTCALVLGRRMGFLLPGGESKTGRRLAAAVRGHFLATRDTYFGLPLWRYFTTPAYSRLTQCEGEIYELAIELIASAADDDATIDSEVFQSMLNAPVDEREKTATIVDFISAGIHTLKNSFLFLLHLVGRNPAVQALILRDGGGPYAKACMNESFRLYPTANTLARIIDAPIEVSGGHTLKAGSVVVCHTGIASRDEAVFKDADAFRPERWLNAQRGGLAHGSALFCMAPFGSGRRVCPGKRFIEHILPILLYYTVKNYELTSTDNINVQFEFLLAPAGPVQMMFKDRMS